MSKSKSRNRILRKTLPITRATKREYDVVLEKMAQLGPFYHSIKVKGVNTTGIHDHPTPIWNLLYDHIPLDIREKKCLDIGCNSGFYSLILAHNGAEVLGIDNNQAGLDVVAQAEWLEAQLKTGAKFKKTDLMELPDSHKNSYDLVMCLGVYHHLPDTDSALQKINKLMKKDALLFFGSATNRYGPSEYYAEDSAEFANDPTCYRIATPEDILEDLEENGFTMLEEILIDSSVFYGVFKKTKTTRKKTSRFTEDKIAEIVAAKKKVQKNNTKNSKSKKGE